MTIYIGPLYACPPHTSDLLGVEEGSRVASMTADNRIELRDFARTIGVPDEQFLFPDTPRWRYLVKRHQWNLARARGATEVTAQHIYLVEARRTSGSR